MLWRGSEARRGKSHCTKQQHQTRIFLAPPFLPCGAASSQLGHTSDQTTSPHSPPQYCAAISRTSYTPSLWHRGTLQQIFCCRLLIMYPPWLCFLLNYCSVIHVPDNPSPDSLWYHHDCKESLHSFFPLQLRKVSSSTYAIVRGAFKASLAPYTTINNTRCSKNIWITWYIDLESRMLLNQWTSFYASELISMDLCL